MKFVAATNVGKHRTNNEDCFYVDDIKKQLFILADGMGGHLAGEEASSMVTSIISEELENLSPNVEIEDIIGEIMGATQKANHDIYEKSLKNKEYQGMGTTLSLGYLLGDVLIYTNIGDSRIYHIRDNLEQLTKDDSFVNYLIELGEISEEEAVDHPKKNVLTKAVGTNPDISVMINTMKVQPKDYLLFCSDGLTNMVSSDEIYEIIVNNTLEDARDCLIEKALDNGGIDNITLILIYIE
ncbi:MAG: Stp1/IreP family PP2C-type Ser/Thr phosphatase [Tissierellia bacterium]|nr:Stp1/IreP family PP2C-type Ser/Thr phosphatase [Tissierellia bacterium]